jgi:hypothetical protein
MVSDEDFKKIVFSLRDAIRRSFAETTALRLLLTTKGLISYEEFAEHRQIVLSALEARRTMQEESEAEINIEALLKEFEGPIQ